MASGEGGHRGGGRWRIAIVFVRDRVMPPPRDLSCHDPVDPLIEGRRTLALRLTRIAEFQFHGWKLAVSPEQPGTESLK